MTDDLLPGYLSLVNEASRETIRQRLTHFLSFLRVKKLMVRMLTPESIAAYAAYLNSSTLKESSRYAYLSALRQCVAVLHKTGVLPESPWPDYIRTRRPDYTPRKVPTMRTMLQLLERSSLTCTYPGRTRAILELAYGCGLRRMELRNLNVSDIRGDTLFIRGKGGKERLVPLGHTAAAWLESYMNGERLRIVAAHNPLEEGLFVSARGKRMGLENYEAMVRRLSSGSLTLHSLRHACATHMLENGASIGVLQKLLGHSSISITQQYARVETTGLRKVLERCHPRP
jgi:site-specific recombinase XerD